MAKAGDEFARPNGERLIFRRTAKDTNGEFPEMDVVYGPNSIRSEVSGQAQGS